MPPTSPPSVLPDEGHRKPVDTLRVLVVEDNPVNAFMAAKMLEQLGHRVQVVSTGGQAVEAVAAGDFEVVLMDVQVPGLDGLDATRRIREAERQAGRPVRLLAMTAAGEPGETERRQDAGVDGVVVKPFTLETLAAVLRIEPVEKPPLDRERLAVQLGGDATAVTEVLRSFAQEAPRTLTRLREALTAGDAKGAEHSAHRLKGALLWIAADLAADRAEAVESRARSGDLDLAPVDELVREVERVLEEARQG